ncbi:MAG TPA: hypothetical protein VMT35_06305, partial [Ignavibacteriaceae bacterium]|nr:hypothetical protein [Ignavibacteriaceae bacterium]
MSFAKQTFFLSCLIILSFVQTYSQTIMGAGILTAVIDGQKDSVALNISSHNEPNSIYCDVNGGTSQTGMFHFIFEKTASFKDIKPQTIDLTNS